MIECSEKNIWYKKRRKNNFKRCFSLFLSVLIIVGLVCYYKYVVADLIIDLCSEYAYSYSTESVNTAVLETIEKETSYNDFISVEKNAQGEIILLSANTVKVNKFTREISYLTMKYLNEKMEKGIPISVLTFTGIGMLSGYGTKIKFKTVSVSSVTCELCSEFISVGINQTLHSISANIKSKVIIKQPLKSVEQEFQTKVLICESVLVGKIPEVILNGRIFGN